MQPDSPQARDYVLIQDLAADDRPREKAMCNGIKTLSKAELIAIIFGNGIKGKSVLTMSQELLARNDGRLSTLARKSIKELVKENPGIGPAKAIALAAAIELGMRCRDESPTERPRITGSKSVYSLIRNKLELLNHEEFWVIVLTRSNHVLDMFRLSQGGTAGTVVDSKLLFKKVVECGDVAASIVLAHNHPSGTLKPSVEDDRLTAKIKEGGKLLDLQVLDHIIVTHESYYSYNDEGRL